MTKTRFKPMLAAAVASGLIPVLDQAIDPADGATLANFSFESGSFTSFGSSGGSPFSTVGNTTLSTNGTLGYSQISYLADAGTGTVIGLKTGTSGTAAFVSGNGGGRALTTSNTLNSTYTFQFGLDDVDSVVLGFDATGSSTGPRDFVVLYSLDGTSFSSFTTFSIVPPITTGTNSTGGTFTGAGFGSFLFSAPAALSDSATGAAGQSGFLQFSQSGTVAINGTGTVGATGTVRFDNVLITGNVVPEPASAAVILLGSAGLLLRRRSSTR